MLNVKLSSSMVTLLSWGFGEHDLEDRIESGQTEEEWAVEWNRKFSDLSKEVCMEAFKL